MKYRFKVYYINKIMRDFVNLMSIRDMHMNMNSFKDILVFTCEGISTIQDIKNNIIEAYQQNNCEVVQIEGGTLE